MSHHPIFVPAHKDIQFRGINKNSNEDRDYHAHRLALPPALIANGQGHEVDKAYSDKKKNR
jgi:hypothetical protein